MTSHSINIQTNGIILDGTFVESPLALANIVKVLGEPVDAQNPNSSMVTLLWQDAGVRAFVTSEGLVKQLDFYLSPSPTAKFIPENPYTGQVLIDGTPLTSIFEVTPETERFNEFSLGDMKYEALVLHTLESPLSIFTVFGIPEVAEPSKASIPLKAERPLTFSDFNFKLAIINELMFGDQPVLTPFNLQEFIRGYSQRNIDTNLEGFEPIPEVIEFFNQYEVDEKYASLITSLYLDGGNELYLEIAPLWGGDTPVFDIKDFSDIQHFPNLKEITNELFPLSDEAKTGLEAKGITVL